MKQRLVLAAVACAANLGLLLAPVAIASSLVAVLQWPGIAFLLVVLAFAFFANSLWFIVTDGLLFCLLHFGVVKREENYLAQKFGDAYREYCCQVRRWI